jgi:YD repeat-containing protein
VAGNRISEDAEFFYHHDEHGRLTEKDERSIRDGGSHNHHYRYDNQHRLVHYRCEQQGTVLLVVMSVTRRGAAW